jgi:hypothetical protein
MQKLGRTFDSENQKPKIIKMTMCKASEKQSHKNRHRSIVLVAKIGL